MRTLAHAAWKYASHGWHIFPLQPRAKAPMDGGRGFLDATTDLDTISAWWARNPDANIGLLPGRSGLVVIDIDGPVAEADARRLGLLALPTLACTTGRDEGGRHLYFKHPSFHVGNGTKHLPAHVDVRGDRGYVLLPPSVHPTGRRYEWNGKTEIGLLPRVALDAIRACQEPEPERIEWHALASVDTAALDYRIGCYLTAVGNCNEGSRNSTAFRVAAMLVRDFALTTDFAWGYLVSWNAGNIPPLPTRELRHCLYSAARNGRHAVGSGLGRVRPTARDASHTAGGYGKRYGKRFGGGYGRRQ